MHRRSQRHLQHSASSRTGRFAGVEPVGLVLFERAQEGLRATAEAAELLALAESVEASVDALARQASGLSPQRAGEIRVTVPDLVAELLMQDLADFAATWPQIQLRIEPTYEVKNLKRREADVAIRVMPQGESPSGELVGRKAGTIYAATYGQTDSWIGWWGDERDGAFKTTTPFADRPTAIVLPDARLQLAACVAGLGLSGLACFMADPVLERHTEPRPSHDIWVLVHPDLRRTPAFASSEMRWSRRSSGTVRAWKGLRADSRVRAGAARPPSRSVNPRPAAGVT